MLLKGPGWWRMVRGPTLGSNDLDSPACQQKFLPDRFIQTKVTTGLFCCKIFKANLALGLNL